MDETNGVVAKTIRAVGETNGSVEETNRAVVETNMAVAETTRTVNEKNGAADKTNRKLSRGRDEQVRGREASRSVALVGATRLGNPQRNLGRNLEQAIDLAIKRWVPHCLLVAGPQFSCSASQCSAY